MMTAYEITTQYKSGLMNTHNGWQVTYKIEDATHARLDVNGHVTINRVLYRVYAEICPSHYTDRELRVTLRRKGTYVYGTASANDKARAELQPVVFHVQSLMKQQNTTRDAMLAETQSAIKKIEAHMQMLQDARATLLELSETISGCNDSELSQAGSSLERERIAGYYEPRQANNIPYWCKILDSKIK